MTTFLSPPSLNKSCGSIETLRNVLKYQFLYPNSFKSGSLGVGPFNKLSRCDFIFYFFLGVILMCMLG